MKANVKAREVADDECKHLLDILEEVGPAGETCERYLTPSIIQARAKWEDVPMEEIQSWALQTAESINSTTLK